MRALIWLLPVLLAACGGREPVPARSGDSSRTLLDAYVAQHASVDSASIDAGRRRELEQGFAQLTAAAKLGEVVPGATARADIARLETLANTAAEAAGVYAPPTDAELKEAYQAYLQTLPASEFHAAHILVANEPLATAVIAELNGGSKFSDVAARRSADDSKSEGGDLGWIHPGHLPPAFFDALQSLEPGEYTKAPVHTPYGWHVIELIATRPASTPGFEQVKAQLATNRQQDRYRKFLDDSLKASNASQ